MPKYSDEVHAFIAQHVQGTTTKDLVDLVNSEFDLGFTESKMKAYKGNHKLRSGTPSNPPGLSRKYSQEVQKFILDNYLGTGYQAMADLLNAKYGTSYTKEQMQYYYKNHKLNSGLGGSRFKKGHVPANKGVKGINYEGAKATQFKKGNRTWNHKPVGSERVNVYGYTEVKVADPKKWRAKHSLIWEAANGPIPKGHVVIFGDGNKENFALDNLLLITRTQLVRLNQNHLIQNDTELTKTGIIIADIYSQICSKQKKGKKTKEASNVSTNDRT